MCCFTAAPLSKSRGHLAVTYFIMACNVKPETWTITNRGRKQLNIFERKVYRRILGPVYDDEKENWRILTLRLLMSYIYIYIYIWSAYS